MMKTAPKQSQVIEPETVYVRFSVEKLSLFVVKLQDNTANSFNKMSNRIICVFNHACEVHISASMHGPRNFFLYALISSGRFS